MPDVITTLRQRHERRDKSRRSAESRTRQMLIGLGFTISVLLAFAALASTFAWAEITRDLPSIEIFPALLNAENGALLQPTRLYDRAGKQVIAVLAPVDTRRNYISLNEISNKLRQTTVIALDPDFWQHAGYSLNDLNNFEAHPTLAQRLVSDLLLWDEAPSLRRAIRERILAAQITSRYGREKILEWYLNSANFGHYAFGVDAAAQLYFGKSAGQLTLFESALLTGVNQSPALNPFDSPQSAPELQKDVLDKLFMRGLITLDETKGGAVALKGLQAPQSSPNIAPAFSDLVLSLLDSRYSRERIERGGLNIITTLDFPLQLQAACTALSQVRRLNNDTGEVLTATGDPCEAVSDLPSLPSGSFNGDAAASVSIIDPTSGQVLALVGETDKTGNQSGSTERRAGSLINSFIYFSAIARSALNPSTTVWDIPGGLSGQVEEEQVSDGVYRGPVRLRVALGSDLRVPAAELLTQLGVDMVARTSQAFNLQVSPSDSPKTILDGNVLVSPLDLARAFGIFADQGILAGDQSGETIAPVAVLKVESVDHATWYSWSAPQVQAVTSPQLAYLMTDMLRDPISRLFASGMPAALDINRPAAARTGQTIDGKDNWAVGYTPSRVVAVWMGGEDAIPPAATQGLWRALAQAATGDLPIDDWQMPQGIAAADVCDPSGLLPTNACPSVVREIFLEENRPVQYDNLYRSFLINRETNLLATAFTPPELTEERVYLVVPEPAKNWASSAGLSTPPDAYDTIQAARPNSNINISLPESFSILKGKVDIRGTADGDNFLFYRLIYGKGLNPHRWFAINDKLNTPVNDGLLANWDTSGLEGLYVVQLQVVHLDQTIEMSTVAITVDNTSPEITLNSPEEGESLGYATNREVSFIPAITDNIGVEKVEFYLDGKLLENRTAPPFMTKWTATVGEHTLKLIAFDSVGNQTEKTIKFTIQK
jgi:membrane peptidoglycan carboxypeptidase